MISVATVLSHILLLYKILTPTTSNLGPFILNGTHNYIYRLSFSVAGHSKHWEGQALLSQPMAMLLYVIEIVKSNGEDVVRIIL